MKRVAQSQVDFFFSSCGSSPGSHDRDHSRLSLYLYFLALFDPPSWNKSIEPSRISESVVLTLFIFHNFQVSTLNTEYLAIRPTNDDAAQHFKFHELIFRFRMFFIFRLKGFDDRAHLGHCSESETEGVSMEFRHVFSHSSIQHLSCNLSLRCALLLRPLETQQQQQQNCCSAVERLLVAARNFHE